MKRAVYTVPVLALLLMLWSSCENPFKEDKKKELVLILVDDYLEESGRYIFFWNGKDKNNNYVEPGRYIYVMEIRDWQDQGYLTVRPGGVEGKNDESRFEPGSWIYPELEKAFPDTFKVKSGVNIPILVAEPARVKVSIYKD